MPFLLPQNLKHFLKESTWVVIGQIVTLMGSLVLVRVLTSYLTPNEYGQLALSLTAVGLISQVAMNSVGASIGRFFPVAITRQDLPNFTLTAHKILRVTAGASLLLGIFLSVTLWLNQHSDWALLCLLGFSFATLSFYNFTANTVQNAARYRAIVALNSSLEAWLKVLLGVFIIVIFGASASSALIGYMIAVCFVLVSQWYFFKHISKKYADKNNSYRSTCHNTEKVNQNHELPFNNISTHKHNQNEWQHDIWQFAWPFATWGVFTWAQQVSDIWSLKTFTSTLEVGLYTVVFQLGYAPILLLNTMVQVFLGPILNQLIEPMVDRATHYTKDFSTKLQNNPKKTNAIYRITWITTFLSLTLTFLMFIIVLNTNEWLFSFLVASEFRSASIYLPYMILAGGLFSAGQILSLKLMSEFNSRRMLSVKIFTALLGLIMNIIGAWAYGISGVIGSMIIFSLSYFLWMVLLTWRTPQ
jgi:O-antigen/teichoic acid export membrane protein